MDETQEIYYLAVMRAIAATDYSGYVGTSLVPKGNPLLRCVPRLICATFSSPKTKARLRNANGLLLDSKQNHRDTILTFKCERYEQR